MTRCGGKDKFKWFDMPKERRLLIAGLIKVMRSKTDPPPKVKRYYYLPDGRISYVYDDGYEVQIEDTSRDDEGLRREGWVPLTNEMSIAALKLAEKEKSSPYLQLMTQIDMKEFDKPCDFTEEDEKYWDNIESVYGDGSGLSLLCESIKKKKVASGKK